MDKTVVELFAGVGGFHKGLKDASEDFNVIWANQWEPGKKIQHAFNCYKHHFEHETECVNIDIAVAKKDIPSHTLLVGGFPCQDYSVARTGAKGMEGKKGVLWWEINSILKDKRPPFVLLENVDRLLKSPTTQRGRDFGVMLSSFAEHGYAVEWRVINAADYGFAQRRRRVFIFAYHNRTAYYDKMSFCDLQQAVRLEGIFAKQFPIEPEFSFNSTDLDYNDLVDVSEKFEFNFHNAGILRDKTILSCKTTPLSTQATPLKEILEHNVDEKYFLKSDLTKWKTLKNSKSIERTSKTGHKYTFSEGSIAFPDPIDRPARTMLTSESSINRSTHVVIDLDSFKSIEYMTSELEKKLHSLSSLNESSEVQEHILNNLKLRLLTPVECELLNGFTKNWTNTGMPEKFRYFCMGNALVVGIVEKLGQEISKIIDKEKAE